MLSNVGLRAAIASGQLAIENLQDSAIQPASIDLHLGSQFIQTITRDRRFVLDPYVESDIRRGFDEKGEWEAGYIILPSEFVLVTTERVTLGNKLVAQVAGKSSLARLGLMVESAGFIDPGFDGPITLELFNQSPNSILLTPGMPIAQLAATRLDSPADPIYQGSYTGSTGPVTSRYWKSNRRPE